MSSPPTSQTAKHPHRFIIVIPVADRPQHIQACLDSLSTLLRRFPYAQPIDVVIADDSADSVNVAANQAVAARSSNPRMRVIHFGPDEQFALSQPLQAMLPGVLGSAAREKFGHKGQGVMRNIAYLKAAQMVNDAPDQHTLIWSLDSDQEFRVNLAEDNGYVIDYFGALDQIFSRTDALLLTGKVVGDPPVSPAVMTRNFLDDVIGFLRQTLANVPACACQHHETAAHRTGEAAYHDMADLFGFTPAVAAYRYPCTLAGEHSESDCFAHFAARLNSFFYGEHPTRISYYQPSDALESVQAARTVYAGNYVFRPAALKYFIPFAALRLRMSGPTLGRLIKAEIGPRFVSANLPMLHKRTVESGGQAEFRPGIDTTQQDIDMSGEFERQFYGDVMLFTIETLTTERRLANADFAETLDTVRAEMLEKYNTRQRDILEKLQMLVALLHNPAHWWNHTPKQAAALAHFNSFVANIQRNFGADSTGHARINAAAPWEKWRADLSEAIARYPADRQAWEQVLCAG